MNKKQHVPSRLRLRRRLLLFSAPVVIVMVLAAVKMISVVAAGNSAQAHFADGDVSGLRTDVSTLRIANVIEPDKAPFAAGTLAVLEGRLDQADAQFAEVLSRTDPARSCATRVNLELVRERQGDLQAWEGRPDQARDDYRSALALVQGSPVGCFAGNTDPDVERRAIRNDAAARLTAKMATLATAPPPPPPAPSPPPPASGSAPEATDEPETPRELQPGDDPIERLQQLLEDAAR